MKFFLVTLLLCVLALALVSAVPVEDGVLGDIGASETNNPQDPDSILKLLLLKKKLLLLG